MELIAMMRGRGNSTRAHYLKNIIVIDSLCLKKPLLIYGKNAGTPFPAEPRQAM